MKKPIRMVFYQPGPLSYMPTSAYEMNFKGPWAWLQRLCFKILNMSGGLRPHFDAFQIVQEVVIDPDQTADKIYRMAADQLAMLRDEPPKRILLGRKEFMSLHQALGDIRSVAYFSFELDYYKEERYRTNDPYRPYQTRRTLYKVPIEVIPWMEGVLVL